MTNRIYCSLLIFLLIGPGIVYAQDIEKVSKAKPVKISGGFGTDHVFYYSDGIEDRRNSPYQLFLTGNLNFLLFEELSLPVSFTYSNQRFNYNQPLNQQQFNQFGMSPKYRKVTGHLGWRSMAFSPYSLNGHTFLGAGAEYQPDKYHISAMYGRFLKAVEPDTTVESGNRPAYQRMGGAINFKYEDKGNIYGFSVLRSEDQPSSLNAHPDSLGIAPEQNFVFTFLAKHQVTKKLKAEIEYGNSSITQDVRLQEETGEQGLLGIIRTNSTTVSYSAYKAGLSYELKKAKVGIGYERIGPGYRTHGAYFFNNDLENIAVNYARPFFKDKVNLDFSIGVQRNNLDDSKVSTMKRRVGSLNLGWQASDKLNFGFNYSNFQTFTNMHNPFNALNSANPYQDIDTLNYMQVNQSVSLNANYAIKNTDKIQQNLTINGSAQKANEEQGGTELPSGTTFYNFNAAYIHSFIKQALSFNIAANGNWSQMQGSDSKIFGPTAGVSKGFLKNQLKSTLSYSWNTTLNNDNYTGYVGSLRFINTYNVKKKHSFSMSFIWLNRESKTNALQPSFNELTGRIGYNYRF